MSDLLGGFLFIPEQRALTPPQLVTVALQHFSINPAKASALLYSEAEDQWIDVPATQAMQTGQGTFSGMFAGSLDVTLEVLPPSDGYAACLVGTHDSDLRMAPAETEHFIARWIELCEDVQAEYAYFARFELMIEDEHLYEIEFPQLRERNVEKLFGGGSHWFYYFGRELASKFADDWFAHLKEKNPALYSELTWRKLPSGALFVRDGKSYI